MGKSGITPSQKKSKFSMGLFHRLSKGKVPGQSSMDKLMTSIERDIDSTDLDKRKLATDSLFKILPYVLPRESNGNQFNVQINNKIGRDGKAEKEIVVLGLKEFFLERRVEIQDVEERREHKQAARLKEVSVIEQKDKD